MLDAFPRPPTIVRAADPPVSALVPSTPGPPTRWQRVLGHASAAGARLRTWRFLGPAALIAMGLAILGAPALSVGVVGLGAVHYVISIGAQTRVAFLAERAKGPFALPLAPEVEPDEIATPELRDTYVAILCVHEEIRRALVEAEYMQPSLRGVFERCAATALASGRLARLANPLQRYLGEHDAARIQEELTRLTTSAEISHDPQSIRAYGHAAAARARQLETHRHMVRTRDRIRARLEMIRASLEAVAALVVELRVRDLEEVELAGESVAEQLQTVRDELEILEAWSPEAA